MADEESNDHHFLISPSPPSSMRYQTADAVEESGGYGEIVEVQGGHIMRSTGRKDRHSKVCTAKGARDRRVRLSALTAIQFYDVQDRLGFDRPSKAVDWLINKAKSAIDDLAQLPPWNPTDSLRHAAANTKSRKPKTLISSSPPSNVKIRSPPVTMVVGGTEHNHRYQQKRWQMGEIPMNSNELSFLPPSLDSDSIADTIKSFFPVGGGGGGGGGACVSSESPPNYNQPSDLLSRHQNLQLSLQSFQNNPPPLLLHHNHHGVAEPVLFSGENNPPQLDTSATGWEQSHHQQNHQSQEFGRIQRLAAWNSGGGGGGGGFVFASPSMATSLLTPILSHQSQFYSQRSPLQSINTPLIRAWFDPYHNRQHPITTTDDLHNHHTYHIPPAIHQSAIPGIADGSSEFSGFRIPARFQEEQNDGITNKPSFASSDSRH